MKFIDFEYDGLKLSDMGYIVCDFNNKSSVDATLGSQLEFNTISIQRGIREDLIISRYNKSIECTFQICKRSCNKDIEKITVDEVRQIYEWLNRENYHKFKPLADEYMGLYFEGSFNISCIEINGGVYGLELNFISNRPFALEEKKIILFNAVANTRYAIRDTSNREGFIYPDEVTIKVKSAGDLTIINSIENRSTYIANCTANEVITLKYPVISSSESSHAIQNDFNWNFLRIANTFREKRNLLTFSLPCEVKIVYSPIAKVVI